MPETPAGTVHAAWTLVAVVVVEPAGEDEEAAPEAPALTLVPERLVSGAWLVAVNPPAGSVAATCEMATLTSSLTCATSWLVSTVAATWVVVVISRATLVAPSSYPAASLLVNVASTCGGETLAVASGSAAP